MPSRGTCRAAPPGFSGCNIVKPRTWRFVQNRSLVRRGGQLVALPIEAAIDDHARGAPSACCGRWMQVGVVAAEFVAEAAAPPILDRGRGLARTIQNDDVRIEAMAARWIRTDRKRGSRSVGRAECRARTRATRKPCAPSAECASRYRRRRRGRARPLPHAQRQRKIGALLVPRCTERMRRPRLNQHGSSRIARSVPILRVRGSDRLLRIALCQKPARDLDAATDERSDAAPRPDAKRAGRDAPPWQLVTRSHERGCVSPALDPLIAGAARMASTLLFIASPASPGHDRSKAKASVDGSERQTIAIGAEPGAGGTHSGCGRRHRRR